MAIDEVPQQEPLPMGSPEGSGVKFIAIVVVLALLVIGQIYNLAQVSSLRRSLESQRATLQRNTQLSEQLSTQAAARESSHAQQLEALRAELETASKRTGSTGRELRRARDMVDRLQAEQKQQGEQLKQEIALKADQQQVGVLSESVTATRTDLDGTKKTLDATRNELGMMRSELGTLIARNHDEIEALRKMGERDYLEFVLDRNQPQRIAGVGLTLKKTNVKRQRFNLVLLADDMQIEKKDRTVNEPIFFYVGGSKKVYELVVNKVQSTQVRGYISTPKGAGQA